MAFEISIVQFWNKYRKIKKSSLSVHFLKNNFRIIKKICDAMLAILNNLFLGNSLNYFLKSEENSKNAYLCNFD